MDLGEVNTTTLVSIIVSLISVTALYSIIFKVFQNPSFETLRTANLIMAVFHMIFAIIMIVSDRFSEDKWMVFYEEDVIEQGNVAGDTVKDKTSAIRKRIYEKKKKRNEIGTIFKLCGVFSLITSLFHIFPLIFPSIYESNISQSSNPARWIEYFVTSGIMMTSIASVSDIKSEYALLSVFAFTAITNIFGMAIEASANPLYKWAFMIFGFIPFVIPWYMISKNYSQYKSTYKDFEELLDEYEEVPLGDTVITKKTLEEGKGSIDKLRILIIVIFALYNTFPAIQINQILSPEKYRLGELNFIIASFISKVVLNLMVFGLGNRPDFTAYSARDV